MKNEPCEFRLKGNPHDKNVQFFDILSKCQNNENKNAQTVTIIREHPALLVPLELFIQPKQ